jgi:hypothetical protein
LIKSRKRKATGEVAFLFGPNVSILLKDLLATRMVLRVVSVLPIERLKPTDSIDGKLAALLESQAIQLARFITGPKSMFFRWAAIVW